MHVNIGSSIVSVCVSVCAFECVWACPLQFAMCWTLLDCLLRVAYVLSPHH